MNKRSKIFFTILALALLLFPISITFIENDTGIGAGKGGMKYITELTYMGMGSVMIGGQETVIDIPGGDGTIPGWKISENSYKLKPFSRSNIFSIIKGYYSKYDNDLNFYYGKNCGHREICFYFF
jgi:hypothetical protein